MTGIFLHAGWRSSGTWLWERLRNAPDHLGFYEPLHEALAGMKPAQLAHWRASNWQSRHPVMTKPYFMEYAPLLEGNLAGARLSRRYAFDRFFMDPGERHDALRGYISGLCRHAAGQGKAPVLKFTRSQGRIGWFKANFPDVTHAAILRQPWTQFRSGWRCLAEGRNGYFMAAPFLVLERNRQVPEVRGMIEALDLPITPPPPMPLSLRLRGWTQRVRLLPPRTLYAASLALWMLNAARVLEAGVRVLDGDAPPAEMAAPFGVDAGPQPRPAAGRLRNRPSFSAREQRECHALARRALALPPPLQGRLEGWLGAAERQAARELGPHIAVQVLEPEPALWRRAASRLGMLEAKSA